MYIMLYNICDRRYGSYISDVKGDHCVKVIWGYGRDVHRELWERCTQELWERCKQGLWE